VGRARPCSTVDEINRDSSPQDREEVGSSPEVVLELGRRQGGLAAVRSFSAPIHPVVLWSRAGAKRRRCTLVKILVQAEKLGRRWPSAAARGCELCFLAMGKNYRGGDRRVLFIGLGVPVGEVQRLEPKSQLNQRFP
jgi:hypothetical protein